MTNLTLLKPRISEKAYGLSQLRNTYVFDIPAGANKFDVAKAVAGQYSVGVTAVRITGLPGKPKRAYNARSRRFHRADRAGIRKAYVTLKKGDSLPFFATEEPAETAKEKK